MANEDNEEDESIRSAERDPLKVAVVFAVLSVLLISSIIAYSVMKEPEPKNTPEETIGTFVEGVNEKNGTLVLDVVYPPFKSDLNQTQKEAVKEWKQNRVKEYENSSVKVSSYEVWEIVYREEMMGSYNQSEIEKANRGYEDFFGVDIEDYYVAKVNITAEWERWGQINDVETCVLYRIEDRWYIRGSLLPVPHVEEVETELDPPGKIICDEGEPNGTVTPSLIPELTVRVYDEDGEPIANLDVKIEGAGLNNTIITNGTGEASLELDGVYLPAGVDQERIELRITIDHLTGSTTITKVVGVVERAESQR